MSLVSGLWVVLVVLCLLIILVNVRTNSKKDDVKCEKKYRCICEINFDGGDFERLIMRFPENEEQMVTKCVDAVRLYGVYQGEERGKSVGRLALQVEFANLLGIVTEYKVEEMISDSIDNLRIR